MFIEVLYDFHLMQKYTFARFHSLSLSLSLRACVCVRFLFILDRPLVLFHIHFYESIHPDKLLRCVHVVKHHFQTIDIKYHW